MAVPFDHTEDVRGLRVPTLVMAADADMAPPSHFVEVFELLGGGQRDGGWGVEGRRAGTYPAVAAGPRDGTVVPWATSTSTPSRSRCPTAAGCWTR